MEIFLVQLLKQTSSNYITIKISINTRLWLEKTKIYDRNWCMPLVKHILQNFFTEFTELN